MSLHLRIAVGDNLYLLDAARIAEIRTYTGGAVASSGGDLPLVDLRQLFGTAADGIGCCILATLASGETAALIADRAENLVEIAETGWRGIPPIGSVGGLIDAVCLLPDSDRPMLRLRLSGETAATAPRG